MKIPQEMKREELSLAEAMLRIREDSSIPREEVEELIQRLPYSLAEAPAFLCSLDGHWRYEFGVPYKVETASVLGTDQCPEVRILLYGLLKVTRHATSANFDEYISKLSNKTKHFDHLAELDPVLRAKELKHLTYEPRPMGDNSPGPDWAMSFMDGASGLIEVKSRIKELLSLFASLRRGTNPSPHASRMPVLPGLLKDVSRKFPVLKETANSFQGVWVYSPTSFIESQVQQLFDGLDPDKIQFLVVGHGWREYEALTRDSVVRIRLTQRYSLPGV